VTDCEECHEPVDAATRAAVLEKYEYRCQACGRRGPEAGGLATLHVHHIERDPDGMGEHDPANLTVLCRACHSWVHQQPPVDEVPVELLQEDWTELLRQDLEILQTLAAVGPATTGEVARALSVDLSPWAVRERLWVLMGLDNLVQARDEQIVDQDYKTGEWGLTGQVVRSSRGRVPSDPETLLQRIEDEYVRRALDRDCDRGAIAAVLDISERATFYKRERACAYDVPLDAIDNRGGRPADDASDARGEHVHAGDGDPSVTQQQLETDTDGVSASRDADPSEESPEQGQPVATGEEVESNV